MLAEFMEDDVLVKWRELKNQRQKMETRVKQSHEVKRAKGYHSRLIRKDIFVPMQKNFNCLFTSRTPEQ